MTSRHRAHLTIPMAVTGLLGAWLLSDFFQLRTRPSEAMARATLVLLLPLVTAVFGFVLSARAVVRRPLATWMIATFGAVVVAQLLALVVVRLFFSNGYTMYEWQTGLMTGLVFAPVVVAMTALGRRVGRARAGSLMDEVDQRAPWVVVMTSVAIGQLPVALQSRARAEVTLALGVLATLALLAIFVLDVLALRRASYLTGRLEHMVSRELIEGDVPKSRGDAEVEDLGLGDVEHAEVEGNRGAYRGSRRVLAVVYGDPGVVRTALVGSFARNTLAVVAALAGTAAAVSVDFG